MGFPTGFETVKVKKKDLKKVMGFPMERQKDLSN